MGNELHYIYIFFHLINGATSPFFSPKGGLRQECPLSPLLFLLVAKGLSRLIKEAYETGSFKGIKIGISYNITHLLFVNHILIFRDESRRVAKKPKEVVELFCKAKSMKNNMDK
jgi:hypothetical protein